MEKKVGIIGAGIAGLTAALALKERYAHIEVLEADTTVRGIGAGMGLASNAIQAYEHLGMDEGVKNCSFSLPGFEICDPSGKVIFKIDTERLEQNLQAGNFSVHRADLHRHLMSGLSEDQVLTGKRLVGLKQTADDVKVEFEDGTSRTYDYLIGADGVNSKVRQILLPESKPQYAGYWCWRGVVKNQESKSGSRAYWGKQGRFGITPLSNNRIYWFCCVNTPIDGEKANYGAAELREHFKDYDQPVLDLLRQTPADKVISGPIMDLKPLDKFSFERVLLIGDAAHATTPNMGQGACMAIEDVAVLMDELKLNNWFDAGLNFEKRRLDRTQYIIKNSKLAGRIAQLDKSWLIGTRNFLFRNLPPKWTQMPLKRLYEEDFMEA